MLTYVLLTGGVPTNMKDMKPSHVMQFIANAPPEQWQLPGKENCKSPPPFHETPRYPPGHGWSSACKDFLFNCFQNNPLNRPSAADLVLHPFITSVPRIINGTLIKDYRQFSGIDDNCLGAAKYLRRVIDKIQETAEYVNLYKKSITIDEHRALLALAPGLPKEAIHVWGDIDTDDDTAKSNMLSDTTTTANITTTTTTTTAAANITTNTTTNRNNKNNTDIDITINNDVPSPSLPPPLPSLQYNNIVKSTDINLQLRHTNPDSLINDTLTLPDTLPLVQALQLGILSMSSNHVKNTLQFLNYKYNHLSQISSNERSTYISNLFETSIIGLSLVTLFPQTEWRSHNDISTIDTSISNNNNNTENIIASHNPIMNDEQYLVSSSTVSNSQNTVNTITSNSSPFVLSTSLSTCLPHALSQ